MNYSGFYQKSLFCQFLRNNERDLLSSPEGEAAQGEHPLDSLFISPCLRDRLSNPVRGVPPFKFKSHLNGICN